MKKVSEIFTYEKNKMVIMVVFRPILISPYHLIKQKEYAQNW